MDKYEIFCELQKKSQFNKFKAESPNQNLKFLNKVIDGLHGQLLMELYGDKIHKIKPGLVKQVIHSNGDIKEKNWHEYGHIRIGKNIFRVSTCLFDKQNVIQYPIEEQQHFVKGSHFLFTNGDQFLVVDITKLKSDEFHRKTQLQNYEVNISSLFVLNAVEQFGLLDFGKMTWEDDKGIHQITKQLPQKFLDLKLRGCMVSKDPHYILARLENSGSPDYFDYELWNHYKDIYFQYKPTKDHKAVGLQARKNTERLLSERENNIATRCPGIIKKNDHVHFMVFDYRQVNDLERIRKFCHRVYKKYADRI